MPTTDQKSDLLFKKYLGKGSSGTSSLYFNEPFNGRTAVFPIQIWQDQGLIPISASSVVGIVSKVTDLVLTQVPGQTYAFFDPQLMDAIPFNYDFSGSYVPIVKKSDNSVIAFGQNDWVIDIETGMLTFYAGLPSGVSAGSPPKVTFWKYIGQKGVPTGSATASWAGTSSWALTASYAFTSAFTAFALNSSASFASINALNAVSASSAVSSVSSSYSVTGTHADTASVTLYAKTASFLGQQGGGGVADGTASHATTAENSQFATTASYAYFAQVTLGSASYASYAEVAGNSYTSNNAVHSVSSDTASYVYMAQNSISSSYAMYAQIALGTASYAISAGFADVSTTSSYIIPGGGTASYALNSFWAVSASHAVEIRTASYANRAGFADNAESSSYAYFAQVALGTSSYALNAGTASRADYSTNTGYASNAGHSSTAYQADTSYNADNANTASYVLHAVSASYAYFAQVALGTSSYALEALHAQTASYIAMATSASNAAEAHYTSGTSSFSLRGDWVLTASYADFSMESSHSQVATTASYSFFAQVVLGTSSYALFAGTASYALFGHANEADYAINAGYAEQAGTASKAVFSTDAGHAFSADAAIDADQAALAAFAIVASSSFSSSYALFAESVNTASYSLLAQSASYALTASYFAGSISGSIINIGLPTDGYYGSGSNGNIAGLAENDKLEDALDKLDTILDKLVPTRPPGLNTKSMTMASSYSAKQAGTNTTFTNVTDIITPSFTLAGGMIVANSFADGNSGTLSALIDGVGIGSRVLTSADDTGTYGGLQITSDADYYVGQSGKSGFWYSLLAQINVQSSIDDVLPHTASLSHTLTGQSTASYFYIDNPATPSVIFASAVPSGLTYVSGVPAFVGGVSSSAISFTATGSFGFTWRFYNSTRVFAASGTGISAGNFSLPSSPAVGSLISGSVSIPINAGTSTENASYTITAYNSKGGTTTYNLTNTFYRLDSALDSVNRVTSGIGHFPSSGYGATFVTSSPLSGSGNEELQMLNGQYRYPSGNYTTALPVPGPDYSSVPAGTYSNFRWVTFNLGSVSAASNLTLTFNNNSNFSGGGSPMSNFSLNVRVDGGTPTTGWIDGNVAYPGVGSPTNNGDAALVVASSTTSVKVVTFGTSTKTGTVYVRVGIPTGDNKRFTSVTMTYS